MITPGLVIVTSNEPKPLRLRLSVELGVPFVQEFLKEGDYLIYDREGRSFGWERKEIKDLLSSIPTRLENQVTRCCETFYRTGLIIEGSWDISSDLKILTRRRRSKAPSVKDGMVWKEDVTWRKSGWHVNPLWGKLCSVQERHPKLEVYVTPDFTGTLRFLEMMSHRAVTKGW